MDEQAVVIQLSLVAPCLNEQDNVEVLADRFLTCMMGAGIQAEIVFVDDGSSDSTRDVIVNLANNNEKIRYVFHQQNQGIATAWSTGIMSSRGKYVCLIDSDLQNPPEEVLKLYQTIVREQCDFVQGIRVPFHRQPLNRRVISRGFNLILNFVFQMKAKDNKSGFVLASQDCLQKVVKHDAIYHHFQSFISISAKRHGFTICEVETQFMNRLNGESYLSGRTLNTILVSFVDIYRARKEFLKKRV